MPSYKSISLFWLLQLGGWLGWGLQFYITTVFWGISERYHWYLPTVTLIGFSLSLVLRYIYQSTWEKAFWLRLIIIAVAAYVAALIWMTCRHFLYINFVDPEAAKELEHWWSNFKFIEGTSSAYLIMICWSGLYFGIKTYSQLQDERERVLKMQAMAHQAQLKMLRYQLNPHFLFNTLNAISTLVLENRSSEANRMVSRLSKFLRHSLDSDPMHQCTLAEEITALKLYLDIEQVRFGERLQVHFDISEQAQRGLLPSLLLQPLVENAIKYAVATRSTSSNITIAAKCRVEGLHIEVKDDGPGIAPNKPSSSTGLGLKNTRERLQEAYGERQSLQTRPNHPSGLVVEITIPFTEEA